jgi:hypothetical protein
MRRPFQPATRIPEYAMQAYPEPDEADPHHDIRGDDESVRA